MNPYDYLDVLSRLQEQLPRALRSKVMVSVRPGEFGDLPTAIYRAGGRVFEFQVREDGLISEMDLAHLCAVL